MKKYPGSSENNENGAVDAENTNNGDVESKKRLRTFSETLRLLDEDVVAELNIK